MADEETAAPVVVDAGAGPPTVVLEDVPKEAAPPGDAPAAEPVEATAPSADATPPAAPEIPVTPVTEPVDAGALTDAAPDAGAPPEIPVTPVTPGPVPDVVDLNNVGAVDAGNGTFLVDTDGDGLLDTKIAGETLEDGTLRVTDSAELPEPLDPSEFQQRPEPVEGDEPAVVVVEPGDKADAPDADAPPLDDFTESGASPEPGEAAPVADAPTHAPPAGDAGGGEVQIDLPAELYEPPPHFAGGAEGGAPPVADHAQEFVPAHEVGAETAAPTAPPTLDYPDGADDPTTQPIEVSTTEGGGADGDDPSLLEQVAEAMGDLWDEATDAVT